uniref:Uncharacterized protein n=1 Tax=Solanum lycopersicum TaxID=4081 RepID=A0A3Q7JB89_SOLLC
MWLDNVGRDMPSSPMERTDSGTTSDMACHHRPWKTYTVRLCQTCHQGPCPAHMVGRGRAWQAINALGQHTQSYNIRRGMPSSPLDSTRGRITTGDRCHHYLGATDTIELRRAWHAIIYHGCLIPLHAIIAIGQHMLSDAVRLDMPYSAFDNTHGGTKSGVA